MTKISWKPGTMLSPVPPIMVTCGTMENPNVLTIAWTGIINSDPALTYISVRPSRHSHAIIKEAGEFVINMTTLDLARAADYCGVKSGKNTNKFEDMGLEIEACSKVAAPMLTKSPISLECKVKEITSYETHDMFLAEIVNVNIDDKYLEEDGRLALEKAGLVAFVHGHYYTLGRDIGGFGFSVDKSKENHTKPRKTEKVVEVVAQEVVEEKRTYSRPRTSERRPSDDRRRSGENRERSSNREGSSERRPSGNGERRPFNRDGDNRRPREDGERRPFNREGSSERRPSGNGERRPFNRDGENRRPREDGERRPFNREGSSERRPSGNGERRPFNRDGENRGRPAGGENRGRPYNREGGERHSSSEGEHKKRAYTPRPAGRSEGRSDAPKKRYASKR